MEYMSVQYAAEMWGISVRRVQVLCSQDRIPGASKISSVWLIPKSAKRPEKLPSGPQKDKINRNIRNLQVDE